MSWCGCLTELVPGFSLKEATCDLLHVIVDNGFIEFDWLEESGKFQASLSRKQANGKEEWSGELLRLGIEDTGSVWMVCYELADGNFVLVGNWVFGEDEGVWLVELFDI